MSLIELPHLGLNLHDCTIIFVSPNKLQKKISKIRFPREITFALQSTEFGAFN